MAGKSSNMSPPPFYPYSKDPSSSAAKDRYRIAIIADPQLTDWMSYHQSGLLLTLVETYTDLFMKRSFRRLHKSLKPDAVLFLGDLNDGGRNSNEDVFDKNSKRFLERVFETGSTAWNKQPVVRDALDPSTLSEPAIEADNVNITGRYLQHVEVPLHSDEREVIRNSGKSVRLYVAGNHDVGFGNTLIRSSMVRYKETFGSVNYEIDVGNHTLVVLDTLALSSGITDIREESQQLLAQIEKEQLRLPRILFTHVPLFRLDTTPCGDARETKRVIVNEWGEQYQNMVQAPLTKDILHAIKPDMVFSGDDHDWCEVAHSLDGTLTPEVTLPTFSFAQGIQQAGFVMLSLYNPDLKTKNVFPVVPTTSASGLPLSTEGNDGTMIRPSMDATFAYEECMLPNQLLIYGCYGLLFGCSLLWILIRRYRWVTRGWSYLHEQHLRSEWRDSLSVSVDTEPQGSTTATAISSRQQQYEQLLDRIDSEDSEDDTIVSETPVEKDASRLSSSFQGRHPMQSLLSTIYWKMVGWDLWNVARFAVPFYVILFVISFL
ncbi:hypothetical protein BGX31_001407 [Mortierella sp. GBA43]|nr:hypothetical protein BGX31_001407 [Mortierella sp. GBA43]